MRRFHAKRNLVILLFPLISVAMTWASPDLKLLSLVPPGTQILAGVTKQLPLDLPDGFLLLGPCNAVDRSDFLSLVGVDDSMIIHQIVFAAGGSDRSKSGEHSLLMSGHFDQKRIFRAAVENGGRISEFRGIKVLVQKPLPRDLGRMQDVRWLAVIDSTVALFGTVSSVQQELDRQLAGSAVDPSLMQKLARLRRDDATWSVVGAIERNDKVWDALGSLDPVLANLTHDGDSFQFGVRYGRKVEVEYEIKSSSSASAQANSYSLTQSLVGGELRGSSLLPLHDVTEDSASLRGVVKVPMTRYKAWLDGVARLAVADQSDGPVHAPGQGPT